MATNKTPIFLRAPVIGIAEVDGTLQRTLLTGGANGTIVEEIEIQGAGTTFVGRMLQFFLNNTLWRQLPIGGATASATVPCWHRRLLPPLNGSDVVADSPGDGLPLILESGDTLKVNASGVTNVNVFARGGDY